MRQRFYRVDKGNNLCISFVDGRGLVPFYAGFSQLFLLLFDYLAKATAEA